MRKNTRLYLMKFYSNKYKNYFTFFTVHTVLMRIFLFRFLLWCKLLDFLKVDSAYDKISLELLIHFDQRIFFQTFLNNEIQMFN